MQNSHLLGSPVIDMSGQAVKLAASSMCCPACGYLPTGKDVWNYPPIYETGQFDNDGKPVWGAIILCECPNCNSNWYCQELRSNDAEKLIEHIQATK